MKLRCLLICFFLIVLAAQAMAKSQKTSSFLLTVKNDTVTVVRPDERTTQMNISVNNNTLVRLYGEVRSENKVIERLAIAPGETSDYQVDTKGLKHLYFVSNSPPHQAVELFVLEDKKE